MSHKRNNSYSKQSTDTDNTEQDTVQEQLEDNPLNLCEENLLKQIDRKIIIKFLKEGKTSRTYIFGIDGFIKSQQEIDTFIKKLQKTLGTSLITKQSDTNTPVYGFGGDHIRTIYDFILKNKICNALDIKK